MPACSAAGSLLILAFIGFAPTPARSQPADGFACAALLASGSRQPAYGRVPGQARCEGFYERNVSQTFVELLSLTRSLPGSWKVDAEGRLSLRGLPSLDTRLVIQPLRSNSLYRVDARLARGATLLWDSRTLQQATGLAPRDLGLLAIAEPAGEPLAVAPVSTGPLEADGATAYAVLRASVAIASLSWRSYRRSQPDAAPGGWQELPGSRLFAWERIALPLTLPADGLALNVDVRALDQQGSPLPLLRFVVLGPRDDKP